MAIPGLTPELPLRAKVRIGIKQTGTNRQGKTYTRPASVDYFVCDDEQFQQIAGDQPRSIRITFPYKQAESCFSSGLEKWAVAKSGRPLLLCYTKGDGTAHGLGGKNVDGVVTLDPKQDRTAFACPAQECNFFGKERHQGCRPQARLNFQLVGGPRDSVYRFETKGLNTIEQIEAVVGQYADLRGVPFELRVEKIKRGDKEFPVVSLHEASQPAAALEARLEADERKQLASLLRQLGHYPPSEQQIAWIERVGYAAAIEKLLEKVP